MTYPKGVNTALRHYSHTEKHFIYYVLAFYRQCKTIYSIYQIIFINKNFIFANFIFFLNFLSSYLIVFYFFQKKKFRKNFTVHSLTVDCLLFTVYCSPFIVHRLLFIIYCSPKLQYNVFFPIAIHFLPPALQPPIHNT